MITYRKNVKDKWDKTDFSTYSIDEEGHKTEMILAQKSIYLDNVPIREVRELSDEHQTSVITTNKKLSVEKVALYMFARWSQENFFKYMRQDYDFDRLLQYSVDHIDNNFMVVNPEYNNIEYYLKKTREKISRRMAILYKLHEENLKNDLDHSGSYFRKQLKIKEDLADLSNQEISWFLNWIFMSITMWINISQNACIYWILS